MLMAGIQRMAAEKADIQDQGTAAVKAEAVRDAEAMAATTEIFVSEDSRVCR